jgi:hypothetical protein
MNPATIIATMAMCIGTMLMCGYMRTRPGVARGIAG